ncbi:DinB family protein [Gordonia amicalis]|uniref:mycothiol transferase n=1 Tax=Gordonia amicalis TaxID=89053 RepID=UPI0022B4C579|nr:DinB family protein [Gordonia amicalis]MCZ4653917.1 DinB family protein [Gordonia amicalis]
MRATDVFIDGLGRVAGNVHALLSDIEPDILNRAPASGANTIAWLVWHLTRVQDSHIADVADTDEVWVSGGWFDRFDLPFSPADSGYGHSAEDVARVVVDDAALLRGYYDATHAVSVDYIASLTDSDLDRIVDTNWDPPVTLGVRLVSVVDDDAQHIGQAAYLRGLFA